MRLESCDVTTQQVCPRTGRVLRTVACKRSCIAYCIDEQDRRVLMIGSGNDARELPVVGGVQLLTKFASVGKATLVLPKRSTSILLSNADPSALQQWCDALKSGRPPPPKAEAGKQPVDPNSKRPLNSPASIGGAGGAAPAGSRAPLASISPACANSPAAHAGKKARDPTRRSPTWQTPPGPLTPRSAALTLEQQSVVRAVQKGESIFFTGGAGTGKSFLLKEIVARLPAATTYVTAPTGMAACQIGGVTVHHWAGIGGGDRTVDECVSMAMRKRGLQWRGAKILVIDEISMLVRLPNAC